jgi:hypothetical protein
MCSADECASAAFIIADALLIADVLAYLAPFSPAYRALLFAHWRDFPTAQPIDYAHNLSIVGALRNAVKIGDWVLRGLLNDQHSIVNALLITENPHGFPLLINPQLSGARRLGTLFRNCLM